MADLNDRATVNAMLHELAEGLQATGSYIAALQRQQAHCNGTEKINVEIVERALSQWARARHASRELSDLLETRQLTPDATD